MRIKKDDTVIVITGKDKGKTGKVLRAMPKENRVVVEGPIDASNLMFYDTKAKEAVKIGYKVDGGKKVRVNRKTGAVID